MGAYRKKVVETQLKKAYSTIAQAFLLSQADNEEARYWNYPNEHASSSPSGSTAAKEFTKKYFDNYLNATHISNKKKVLDIYWSTGELSWQDSTLRYSPGYMLSSGAYIYFSPLKKDNNITVTINVIPSIHNSRVIQGMNLFTFNLYGNDNTPVKLGIRPRPDYKWTCNELNKNKEQFISECRQDTGGGAHGVASSSWCTFMIYCNGWEIPDDYPIKF